MEWQSENLREAAEGLASRSLYVFPLSPRSKEPRAGSTGFKEATLNVKRIRDWWSENKNYNVGIATGPSRIVVIDIDPRHDGDASWSRLRNVLGLKYDTLTSLTGGGGEHVWFRAGAYNPKSGSNSFGEDYPGIDVRAIGGYVVAPPSIHSSGKPYRWEVATDSIATIPEQLEDLLRKCQANGTSSSTILADRAMIPVGKRDVSMTKIAGKLRFIGMADDEVLTTLLLVNSKRCVEPLPERDIRRIVASVFRYKAHPNQENLVDPEIARQLFVVSALDIKAKRTEWFVTGRIPAGEVTIFEGRGGLGKSTAALDLLARASAGMVLPGNSVSAPPRNTLVFGDEDSHALIKARLQVAQADLSKVYIVDGVGEGADKRRFQMPQDLRLLEDAITGYNAEIVYIDSLFNAFGPGYSQNDALDVRRVLGGLADVAHRTAATIIATRHWGKSDRHDKDKGLGSVEITDVARSVVAFDEGVFHPRVMKVVKHNYGQEAEDLGYDFESVTTTDDFGHPMEVARVRWACLDREAEPKQQAFGAALSPAEQDLQDYATSVLG